jgi:4-phospho-D-threonate 3-dehydrogenase / 4-phospho-D-erythronate 3-dehydrogenase
MIKIGITIGDPGGIGPEIVFKTLEMARDLNVEIVIYGSNAVFNHPFLSQWKEASVPLVHCYDLPETYVIGKPDTDNGRASYIYLKTAIDDCLAGKIDAIVTAPICKESLALAGYSETGHTTILQKVCQAPSVNMAFYSQPLSVMLVTIHHALNKVPGLLSIKLLHDTFDNAKLFLKLLGKDTPKIAVAGLNPHAGEHGLFGSEEIEIIIPAIDSYRDKECLYGPFPPDVVFRETVQGNYDMVVAMYHDQGLIPLKLLAFDSAVNVTIGLPFLRTSPDHGTAFDIAYTGKASITSFFEALTFASTRALHGA